MGIEKIHTEGGRGHRVTLARRTGRPNLWLRWWDPSRRGGRGDWAWKDLGHSDVEQGTSECRTMAAVLLAAGSRTGSPVGQQSAVAVLAVGGQVLPVLGGSDLTLAELFARYEASKILPPRPGSPEQKSARQAASDRHRMDLWQRFCGSARAVLTIDEDTVSAYTDARRSEGISDTTIGHEIVFLRGVMNWATTKRESSGRPLLLFNPIARVRRIRSAEPRKTTTSPHRFARIYRHADAVDPQKLLRPLMMLAHEHAWRLSAWCNLWASDIDLAPRRVDGVLWPDGAIRKRRAHDKARRPDRWVPMTPRSRRAAVLLLRRSGAVGNTPLFRAPRADGPWQPQHALDLLRRATLAAGHEERIAFLASVAVPVGDRLELRKGRGTYTLREYLDRFAPLIRRDLRHTASIVAAVNAAMGTDFRASIEPEPGHGFHGLRRKWGKDRKDMPLVDVAAAGDWHPGTLLNHYQEPDARTTLRVVRGGRK